MTDKVIKPKIVVFAGPNGSGKTTITANCVKSGEYINADDILRDNNEFDAMDAAKEAEKRREKALSNGVDFTFETVLSTERNLDLLRRAKAAGFFIRGFYVLTCDPEINVHRVKGRVALGGHDVPEDKIRSRYARALKLLPQFVEVCDICSVYDNSLSEPCRIFKKKRSEDYINENPVWTKQEIISLVYDVRFTKPD